VLGRSETDVIIIVKPREHAQIITDSFNVYLILKRINGKGIIKVNINERKGIYLNANISTE
jgi:hypothetical protein